MTKNAAKSDNQTVESQLTKKQKEAIANLEQSILTLTNKRSGLDDPGVIQDPKAYNQLGKLIEVATKTLNSCRNNPSEVNLTEVQTTVAEALPALKYFPHKNDALYNFGIMMAGFLLVLPGILYVGLAVHNYKHNNRFWLFEFGPTANLKAHARELQAAVEQFLKPDEVKEARYCDGLIGAFNSQV